MPDRTVVIKSPQEIAVMREAGRINALALQTVRELIRPGVATGDLDQAILRHVNIGHQNQLAVQSGEHFVQRQRLGRCTRETIQESTTC